MLWNYTILNLENVTQVRLRNGVLMTQATRHSETAVCVCVVGDADVKDFKALTIDDHLRHGPRCPATVLRDTDVAACVGCGDTSEL